MNIIHLKNKKKITKDHITGNTTYELKIDEFRPIDAGQLNFYLTALDKQVKHPDDQPSIGMIFCPNKDATVVEYALQSINKPIHVPVYELTKALPEALKDSLPTTEEVEAELARRVAGEGENGAWVSVMTTRTCLTSLAPKTLKIRFVVAEIDKGLPSPWMFVLLTPLRKLQRS